MQEKRFSGIPIILASPLSYHHCFVSQLNKLVLKLLITQYKIVFSKSTLDSYKYANECVLISFCLLISFQFIIPLLFIRE